MQWAPISVAVYSATESTYNTVKWKDRIDERRPRAAAAARTVAADGEMRDKKKKRK